MNVVENVSLRDFSTMRLGGKARYFCEVRSQDDLKKAADWAKKQRVPIIVVGQGSNIVWRDEGFDGLLIANRLSGREIISENENSVTLRIGAGENWDEVVAWTVKKNLSGIEFLSLIPGLAGAAPVQNIGAYGGELSRILTELEAYELARGEFATINNKGCEFAYRTSRFKTTDHGRFIITSITLKLSKNRPEPPFYETLQKYLMGQGISTYTPATIREAVIAIRTSKLPDPAKVANNGSFFTNPIISKDDFAKLQKKFPDIKGWPVPPHGEKIKVAAAWLVETAGFKGVHDKETGMATWPTQALVLVNEHAKNTADLLAFKKKIQAKVYQMFGIVLKQEPELLP